MLKKPGTICARLLCLVIQDLSGPRLFAQALKHYEQVESRLCVLSLWPGLLQHGLNRLAGAGAGVGQTPAPCLTAPGRLWYNTWHPRMARDVSYSAPFAWPGGYRIALGGLSSGAARLFLLVPGSFWRVNAFTE